MIQFILMLLGLAFSNNNAQTATCNDNQNSDTPTTYTTVPPVDPGDTGGDTLPILPPKK